MVSLNSYDILTDIEIQRSSVYQFICFLFFPILEVAFALCFYLSAFLRSGSGLSSLHLSICSLSQGLLGSTIFFVRLWGGAFCCVYVCIPWYYRKQAHGTYSEDFHAAPMPTPAEPDESMSRRVLWWIIALLKLGTLMLWNKSQRV